MSDNPRELEAALRNLPRIGKLIARDNDREVWRFDAAEKALRVHFYPRGKSRLFSGNPALRELQNFQRLQKADVPSPRAISAMIGFRLNDQIGDALLLESIDGDESLSHNARRRQLIEILHRLARARLGSRNLSLEDFCGKKGKLYLAEARHLHGGGIKIPHLQHLAHTACPFAAKTDLVRVWRELVPDRPIPLQNKISNRIWRRFIRTITRESETVGRIKVGNWSGLFTRKPPRSANWASASARTSFIDDWRNTWPTLLEKIQRDQLDVIKRDDSGEILSTDIDLHGERFSIVVKRPRRKSLGRRSKAQRSWIKTWKMLIRNVPCEWPLLLMERRVLGYSVESIAIYQRVEGPTLAKVDLDSLSAVARENLFRRAGRILRKIEDLGFTHADAKSTNWIVFDDPRIGPTPILIDVDGVRHYRWSMLGIDRLLRAMKQHTQYTPTDSLHLCLGFAPGAKLARDSSPASEKNAEHE